MFAILFLILAFCFGGTLSENGNPIYGLLIFTGMALAGVTVSSVVEALMKELLAPFVWHAATRLRAVLLPARLRRSQSGPSS